jgi:hypothetical protein
MAGGARVPLSDFASAGPEHDHGEVPSSSTDESRAGLALPGRLREGIGAAKRFIGSSPALFPLRAGFSSFRAIGAAEKTGGLNRSVQHWLEVYLREFQRPKFSAGVD